MSLFTPTRPRTTPRTAVASDYTAISKKVKEEGLLARTLPFYARKFFFWIAVLGGTIVSASFLGNSWFQLILAVVLGIATTQLAFMAHETAHRQVFSTNKMNDRVGLVLADLFAGLSYDWWMSKHTRHHANPNLVDKDPDIAIRGLAFTTEQAKERKGIMGVLARHQGLFFFPLLSLAAADLLTSSVGSLIHSKRVQHRWLEVALLVAHYAVLVTLPFVFFSPGIAVLFILVHMVTFGFYMGISFAPNHKGMVVLAKDAKVDFFRRQVLTSRNIRSNWFVDNMMGGLNYQVEHHLFPSMSRPHLKRARELVMEYCDEMKVHYTETGLFESYSIIVKYMNRVGLSARDPFVCPVVAEYR